MRPSCTPAIRARPDHPGPPARSRRPWPLSRVKPGSARKAGYGLRPGSGRSRTAASNLGEAPRKRRARNAPIGGEPLRAAIERTTRVVAATSSASPAISPPRDRAGWQPYIEGRLHRLQPIAGDEARPVATPCARLSGLARAQEPLAHVDAEPARMRKLGQEASRGCSRSPCRDRAARRVRPAADERRAQPRSASRYPGGGRACPHRKLRNGCP